VKMQVMVVFTEGDSIFILDEEDCGKISRLINLRTDPIGKIKAIKHIRNKKGFTLRDSKLIVDAFVEEKH